MSNINNLKEVYEKINEDYNIGKLEKDEHSKDSCEIVQIVIIELAKLKSWEKDDLQMLYLFTVGTWKHSIVSKTELIKGSKIPDLGKRRIIDFLNKLNEKHDHVGMFGTGTFTIDVSNKIANEILTSFTDILKMEDYRKIFDRVESVFKKGCKGFGAGMASQILYCIKPEIFPVCNSQGRNHYKRLGVNLTAYPDRLENYIENVKRIMKFRDDHFDFKDYRILDLLDFEGYIQKVQKPLVPKKPDSEIKYYWITANPSIWSVSTIKNGGEVTYTAVNKKGRKRRLQSAFKEAKPNDRVVFYESAPVKKIIGVGTVTKGFHKGKAEGYPEDVGLICFKYDEDVEELTWNDLKEIPALKDSEPIKNGAQGSLFHLTKEEFDIIASPVEEIYHEQRYSDYKLSVDKLGLTFKVQDLYFEDHEIIENQITNVLQNNKHIILIGPPGTVKSKLAQEICKFYVDDNFIMSTARSDWTTFDTIGGLLPDQDGCLSFVPGIFLKCTQNELEKPINRWLIIDEINRTDIDKSFGSLFSALTGDTSTLSFSKLGKLIKLIGNPSTADSVKAHKFFINKDWRIIATMNTYDKASLYEMSYAFMRRFAFIPVDIPNKINIELIKNYLKKWGFEEEVGVEEITNVWKVINEFRKIGPAIVYDMYKYINSGGDIASAIILYVLPQFEGLEEEHQINFIKEIIKDIGSDNHERIISFASEYFDINKRKFSG